MPISEVSPPKRQPSHGIPARGPPGGRGEEASSSHSPFLLGPMSMSMSMSPMSGPDETLHLHPTPSPEEEDSESSALFSAEGFSSVEFINRLFPSESSLSKVDSSISQLRRKINVVDSSIMLAIHQQSARGSQARQELATAMRAVSELTTKVADIKRKAAQSEGMVQEICRDIRKLDNAKKHLTSTITTLRRLAMLVSATDQLETLAEKRSYVDAANLLGAVNELAMHFDNMTSVPRIAELRAKLNGIKAVLRAHALGDFDAMSRLSSSNAEDDAQDVVETAEDAALLARMRGACAVVDALGAQVRAEVVDRLCERELSAYTMAFDGRDVGAPALEKTDRRYAWLLRRLNERARTFDVFPSEWRVPQLLSVAFCKVTAAQLTAALDGAEAAVSVDVLIPALTRTLEFEQELADRFTVDGGGGGERSNDDGLGLDDEEEATSATAIRKRYERERRQRERDALEASGQGRAARGMEGAADAAAKTDFRGLISSCFEPHMGGYVAAEERELCEAVARLVAGEKWHREENSDNSVLTSATQLFLQMKRSLKRCSRMTRGNALFQLHVSFKKVLRRYAEAIWNAAAPKGADAAVASDGAAAAMVAAATTGALSPATTWKVKVEDDMLARVCLVVETADYVASTLYGLAEAVRGFVDEEMAGGVEFEDVEECFVDLKARGATLLVLAVETRLDDALTALGAVSWDQYDEIGDESAYVGEVAAVLRSALPLISSILGEANESYIVDKLFGSFTARWRWAVARCRRVSEAGLQQLLLDTQVVRSNLLSCVTSGASGGKRLVEKEMGRAEAMLKAAAAPAEALEMLLPDATSVERLRVTEMRGGGSGGDGGGSGGGVLRRMAEARAGAAASMAERMKQARAAMTSSSSGGVSGAGKEK